MQDFRRLKVWAKAHRNVLAVYAMTRSFPGDERYGLTSQLRRAAASITANIAEGCGRQAGPDSLRFYDIAMGSACEFESHLEIAHDVGLIDDSTYDSMVSTAGEVKRMLAGLIRTLRRSNNRRNPRQGKGAVHD